MCLHTVHLDQQLRLYPPAGLMLLWGSSAAAHRVDFIDEDGGGSVVARLQTTWTKGSAGVKDEAFLFRNSSCECSIRTISNRRRTSFSDSPRYLEVSVDEDTLKKVVLHSVATALASRVFPVPGGPTRRTPWGGGSQSQHRMTETLGVLMLCCLLKTFWKEQLTLGHETVSIVTDCIMSMSGTFSGVQAGEQASCLSTELFRKCIRCRLLWWKPEVIWKMMHNTEPIFINFHKSGLVSVFKWLLY